MFNWPQQHQHLKNCLWFKTCDKEDLRDIALVHIANCVWRVEFKSKQIQKLPLLDPHLIPCVLMSVAHILVVSYLVSLGGPGGWWSLCSSHEVREGEGQNSEGDQSPRSGGYILLPCWGASSSSPSVSDYKTRLWPPPSPDPAVQPAWLFPDCQEWIFCVKKEIFFVEKEEAFSDLFFFCVTRIVYYWDL